MKSEIKQRLKHGLAGHDSLALWAARIRALILAVPALAHRLRFFCSAYVPLGVKLIGAKRIRLGRNTAIGVGSWLNVNDRDGQGPALAIGDHCFIGADNFFTVGRTIVVRDYCLTAKGCAFIGATHTYDDPMLPYVSTGVVGEHSIYIGANCFFGFGARVIGNVTVGHGCVIGAGAEVRESMPPFSVVVGNPARVIKRFDFAKRAWVRWPAESYTEGPSEEVYLLGLRERCGAPIQPLSAAAGCLRDLS